MDINSINYINLDSKVWGPHYWFFLHTIALTYPHYPNDVTKKKYYEFIQNLPLFIPIEQISKEFNNLLEKYPILPYLDNRKSLTKWMHFIHNKINEKIEKPKISFEEFLINYYNLYKNNNIKDKIYRKFKEKIIYFLIIFILLLIIIYNYRIFISL